MIKRRPDLRRQPRIVTRLAKNTADISWCLKDDQVAQGAPRCKAKSKRTGQALSCACGARLSRLQDAWGPRRRLFLDSLYREAAGKAGITYVDVWDGFVDEAGRFLQQGPDFEGQSRRLRSNDGVYFTKAGARKLAHYVEREITRLLAARSAPIALPTEPATPDANALPGQPAPRPLAGPILPLVASSVGTDQLLGGPGSRPAAVDPLAARTLVKGEPLTPPAGRADDFAWRADKSYVNRRRAKPRRHPFRPTPKPPRQHRRERRKKLVGPDPRDIEAAGSTSRAATDLAAPSARNILLGVGYASMRIERDRPRVP
jgi:hypothetical protein